MSVHSTYLPSAAGRTGGGRHVRWIVRRFLGAVTVFWATATFTFCVQALMPGNRAEMMINLASGTFSQPSAAQIAAVNRKYGFDDPLIVQYWHYLSGLVHGDFGESYQAHRPVIDIIAEQI